MNIIQQILVTILSSSSIIAFLLWLVKKNISTEIENSIKNKYDAKLEVIKSDISKSQSILSNSILAQVDGLKATQVKRLKSIDDLWESILEIEMSSNWLFSIESVLTIDEVGIIKKGTTLLPNEYMKTVELTFEQIDLKNFLTISSRQSRSLEKLRPYIGEKLWLLRFIFVQLLGRTINEYKNSYDNNKNLTHWTKDKFLTDSINKVLDKNEQRYIYSSNVGSFAKAINVFKQKILGEISHITSGNLVGESSLKNAIALNEIMKKEK